MEEKYMKKYYVAIFLIFTASTSFAFDSDRCKLVSEATWERFGYKTIVNCAGDRVELKILDAPPMQNPKDVAQLAGYICGWGCALDRQEDMDYNTKLVITVQEKSLETTVGDCVRTQNTKNYLGFFQDLISSWR